MVLLKAGRPSQSAMARECMVRRLARHINSSVAPTQITPATMNVTTV